MYATLIRELTHLKDRLDQTTSVNGSPQPIYEDLARLLATLRGDMRQKHLAMESTIEGLSILNDGVYTYMNMSHATMYDYEPDQLLGKSWTVLYSPAEIERLEREVFPVLPVHGTWTGETRGTSRTGRIVEGEITLTLLEGNGLVCTCHDISARKRLERSRLIASRRLELAADAAGFGIWELEVTTGRMHWDERMFAIYGLEPRSHPVTFEQWSTLLVEEDRVAMMDAAEGLIAGRVEAEVSFRIRRKDGEIRYIRSAATLVGKSDDPRDHDDIRLIGVNWDDTRLQTAAIEVQRNAEVLRRTNEELVRALRARDEFLATVSHELRTPLNAILGFSQLLLEGVHGDLNPKQQTSLNIIDENGRHLLALINDILDISKIDAGMLTLQYDRVAPQLIADGVVKTFWRIAEEKGLRLVVEMSPSLSPIWVDPVRLKQILHNLVSNAVKFTPPRGVVTLRALVDPMRDALVFEVEDTGIGIDPVDIHAIFQPFVQLDAGLDRRFGGTGLGLSLVRMLVAAHGGSIAVKSEAGRGSCFSVTLPRHHRSESPAQLSPVSKSPVGAARTREPDRRPDDEGPVVLVAEDNEANWQFLQILLESMGCRAVRAADGAEAVKKAQELSPPLILMDIQMPGMDGLEAIRRIRSTGGAGAKPRRIVAVTALALPGDRDRCLQAGADQYLSKPIDLAVLRATIRSVTAAAGSSAGAARSTTAARPG